MTAIEALKRTTIAAIVIEGADATITLTTLLELIKKAEDIEGSA